MDQISSITATKEEPVFTRRGLRLWTAEERQDIVNFYREGRKPSWIQKRYNATTGQIAGLIRRERERDESIKLQRIFKPPVEKKAEAPKPTPLPFKLISKRKEPMKRVRLRLVDSSQMVTLMELKPHMCKWPLGDPRQSDFRYCGCNRAENASLPYCEPHFRIATNYGNHRG